MLNISDSCSKKCCSLRYLQTFSLEPLSIAKREKYHNQIRCIKLKEHVELKRFGVIS